MKKLLYYFLFTTIGFAENQWLETTQEDFKDGIYECNIYASQRDSGTIEFASRWDLNCDGYLDIVITNEQSDYSYVYWGSASGYNPVNVTYYPTGTIGSIGCNAGDINHDGYPDLFVAQQQSSSKVRMFRGASSGPNPNNYIDIYLGNVINETCYLADFNKDGYLDLAVNRYGTSNQGAVLYGDSMGISNNVDIFPSYNNRRNIESADFDRDGWLDLLELNGLNNSCYLYWGSDSGFSENNREVLPCAGDSPNGASVADLNNDQYLDIVISTWSNGVTAYIYTGGPNGFSLWQTLLPGGCFGGNAVADLNYDGYLDILFLKGYGVEENPLIYWGSASGYSESNKTAIGFPIDASGGLIADFDYNGYLDILVNNYSYPPEPSYILNGPNYNSIMVQLPNARDDCSMFREIGNVYNRKYYEDYISSVFDAGEVVAWGVVDWDDSLPPGSSIAFFVRSGNTPNPDTSWSDWDSLGKNDDIPDSLNSRYLQYRARLRYTNPSYLPYLFEVRIGYGSAVRLILEPNQADSTLPNVRVDYSIRVINIGIGLDTVDLVYQHDTNWQVGLFDSTGTIPLIDHNNNLIPDVIININDTVPIVLSVTPPSSAQGGEVDSLRLIGNSNINPLLVDTVYITTTIRHIAAILVEPDRVGSTVAGVPIGYDLWVYNQGTNRDTVDLYYNHNKPWGVVLLDSTGSPLTDHNNNGLVDLWVSSSDSVRFRLVVYSPDTALAGEADTLVLTGRSGLNPSVTDNATIITIIEGMGSIIIFPDQQATGLPGDWVNFVLSCRNNQNFTDTIDLRYIDQFGYSYQLLDSLGNQLVDHNGNGLVDLSGVGPLGGEVDFNLRVLVPANMPSGTRDTILVYGYSGRDSTVRDSSVCVLMVGTVAQVLFEPDCSDSAGCGDSIDYLLWVNNLGNAGDVIDLSIIGGGFSYTLRDLGGNLLMDTDGDGLVDLGLVSGFGGCESLVVRVKVPLVNPGVVDTVFVRAISSNNTVVFDDVVLMTGSLGGIWGLLVEPDQGSRVEVGGGVSYPLWVVLRANLSDVVNIKSSDVVSGWQVELLDKGGSLLRDNNQDGLVDLGVVNPDVSKDFVVRVSAPDTFSFSGLLDSLIYFDLVVYGECSMREEVRDSVVLRTILVPPFGVHNFRNPFRDRTQFIFSLPKSGRVNLEVYTRAGELVRRLITNRHYDFGIHYYPWDGKNDAGKRLAPGVYIYVFDFYADDGEHKTAKKKAVIIK
ncbi:MAG: FG-GAP-like repeat-containing protein [candidate division WOR-3 bacterium]